jgi:hypothetical protein
MLVLRQINFIKSAFREVLRVAFASDATPEQYRYSTNPRDRQISIHRAYPKKTIKYPALVIETENVSSNIDSLGQEIIREEYDNGVLIGVWYSGNIYIKVSISVFAKTTTDREKLTDLLSIYCRYVFRDAFAKQDISYLGVEPSEDGEEVNRSGDEVVYKGKVVVGPCQMFYEQYVDLTLLDAVNKIDFSQLRAGTTASDLHPTDED